MFQSIISFYKKSKPATQSYEADEQTTNRYLTRLQWSSFLAGTIGYSLYYVCRTSLNVVKKPIMESGLFDAQHLGIIGSTLLFAYAIGKLVNGFLADFFSIQAIVCGSTPLP